MTSSPYTIVKGDDGKYAIMYIHDSKIELDGLNRQDLLQLMSAASKWLDEDDLEKKSYNGNN